MIASIGVNPSSGIVEESSAAVGVEEASSSRSRPSWAMLIMRVYEMDPLSCPTCRSQMEVVAFNRISQQDTIKRILRGHQIAAMVGG